MEQTEEELLEYAKMHYPVGTTVMCLTERKPEKITSELKWSYGNIIQSDHPCTRVYKDSEWATIVNQVNPMLEIQKQCKEKFPIGCTFNNIEGHVYVLSEDNVTYTIRGTNIWAHNGAGCLYSNGKWATLVEPDYKALQNKAWEIFKDVKEGDRYISTRGIEHTAIKNSIKTTRSAESNCYIECGSGFLWEIQDGKELYAKLLPKEEEKWIPKIGEWVVSLEDKPGYREKDELFQVLEVSDGCIYYKECVNGDISSFRPAETHEILALTISTHTGSIISHVTTDLSIPKHLLEYKEPKVKPKSNSEEVKIQIKKSKTIKI